MEGSSPQRQNLVLNSSDTAYTFPPHRRRPLRSRTYSALIGIMSHSRVDSPHLPMQVDSDDFVLRPVRGENGSSARNEVNSVDVLAPQPNSPNSKVSEDTLVQETTIVENKDNFCFQDGGVDGKNTTEPKVDHVNVVTDVEQEGSPAHRISRNFSTAENQMGGCDFHVSKELENVNSILDIQMVMGDFGTLGELEVGKDFCIGDFSDALDSGMDMVDELLKSGEDGQENGMVLDENIPKRAEYELKLKDMELEKLIQKLDVVESSCSLNANNEMEEGEISGEEGFVDPSFDALSKFDVLMGERNTEVLHASEDSFDKEKIISNDEDRGRETTNPLLVNVVNSDADFRKVESRLTFGKMQDCHSQKVFGDSYKKTQRSGPIAICSENLTPGRTLHENAAEDQNCATTEKEHDLSKKKRKKGPLTKERRAKKKKKERIKRAEKNRELGVKRATPQLIIKTKKISYCRHYLKGKCHEGEKCNFSHDTVPETKSTSCSYFARGECMKGKDCPFDHQLSKYPCIKHTANGSCTRGSKCLFSHELPAKQSFSITPNSSVPELTPAQNTVPDKGRSFMESNVTKPEMKFRTPLNNMNTSKHTSNYGTPHQRNDGKLCFAGNSPGKSIEPLPANPVPRTARKAPRGISFLLNGEKSLGESSKHKQDGPSVGTTNRVDVGCRTSLDKLNVITERVAPKKPRGINFLSFAQPSSDDSSSKLFSNLPLSNSKTGKSVINNINEGKLTSSLLEKDGALKVNRLMNQSAANLVQELNQSSNRSLEDTVQIPSLSFGGTRGPSTDGQNSHFSSSFKTSLLSNTPSSVQNAIQSTLAFAEKFDPDIKVGSPLHQRGS